MPRPPICVLLDSSALRALSPGGLVGKTLAELGQLQRIQLFVPNLVLQEVLTGVVEDTKRLNSGQRRLSDWAPRKKQAEISEKLHVADALLQDAASLVK